MRRVWSTWKVGSCSCSSSGQGAGKFVKPSDYCALQARARTCMHEATCLFPGRRSSQLSLSLSLSRCRFRWPEFPAASTRRVSRKSRVRESENVLCSALLLLLLLIRCPFSAPPSRVEIPLGGRLPIRGIETCVRAPEAQHASIYIFRS